MPGVLRSHEINVQDHRLQYLSLAARYGSMRGAADFLGMAPSSISRQISLLERSLRIDLVEKGPHKMKLTQAGRLLIDYYDRRTCDHADLLRQLSQLRNTRATTVRVAVGEALLPPELMAVFGRICTDHADTNIDIALGSSEATQRMVEDDDAQIGLMLERPCDVRLRVHACVAQPVCALMVPGHRLSARADLTIAEIIGEHLLMPGKGTRLYEIIHSLLRETGLCPDVVMTSTTASAIVEGARVGMGIGLMPQVFAADAIAAGQLIARPIRAPDLQDISLHVITGPGRPLSQAGVALLHAIVGMVRKWAPDAGASRTAA